MFLKGFQAFAPFEVAESELVAAATVAGRAMCEASSLRIPLQVSYKAGPNWAELTSVQI